ncbi:hypothetical protein [uncultured Kiloniella sp.]|uniref:hypothetical protein n=1 Tax=uncultured Kiloniella sp. TaxID=1133091 RepID=UPI002611E63E|nr:hypothetical protein [uncultured Kiloniella sp.]
MAESQTTPENTDPAGTGGEPKSTPATTPPTKDVPGTTDDNETVTIKKSDLKNLQSQRDKNRSTSDEALERATNAEQYAAEQMQKDDINEFLSDPANKEKYPDVELSDLKAATSDDQFEELAAQTQARVDKAAQRRLGDIEKAGTPTMSPEDKAAKLKKLRENPSTNSLEQMIDLQQTPTK